MIEKQEQIGVNVTPSKMILGAFIEDAGDALRMLSDIGDDMESFAIIVHGMKSALANIGELDVSNEASLLEKAAESMDLERVSVDVLKFIERLTALKEKYALMLEETESKEIGNPKDLQTYLEKVIVACDDYDDYTAKVILDKLEQYQWESVIREMLQKVRSLILVHSEFEQASEIIGKLKF